jgi:PAP2 superfamily
MRPDDGYFSSEDWVKAGIIAAIVAVDAVWIALAGYRFDFLSTIRLIVIFLFLLAVAEIYRRWRPMPNFIVMTRETAWLLAFSGAAAVLSNLVVTLDFPRIDEQLVAFDHAFGFDWQAYYADVTARKLIGLVFSALYFGALPLIAFAVIALSIMDRLDRARELVLAAMIGALIAITISALAPSSGALAYFRPDESLLVHRPIVDLEYKQTFFDLRSGAMTFFSLDGIKGLIAFPSYHAALNVIIVLAFRGMPKLFWPILVLNIAMLATAPIEGGHHLADVVGGSVVAIVAVWLASLWQRKLLQQPAVHARAHAAGILAAPRTD